MTGYGPAGPVAPPAPAPVPAAAPAGEVSVLAAVADVPVGGGVVLADRDVVVTQPVSGTFKAFSATCTHQGCAVSEVANGTINCPCHGSRFAVADGSVTAGPATTPLPEKTVAVQDNAVVLS
jgi:Rieske Fe-S protein